MIKRDVIRNMLPGYRLEIQCENTADVDSTYQNAWQVRKELGIDKSVMPISRIGSREMVIIEYLNTKKGGEA